MSNKYTSLPTIDVVISRFNEDLEWIYASPYNEFFNQHNVKVIVYNKGNNSEFSTFSGWHVVGLPNIGMCDHTYLYHITDNYDRLAEITIFLPGSLELPDKAIKSARLIQEICEMNSAVFIHNHCDEDGIRNNLYHFQLDSWTTRSNLKHELCVPTALEPAEIRPFGAWFDTRFGTMIEPRLTYLGIFSVDRRDIIQHSFERYNAFLSEIPHHTVNSEVVHYIERSWCAIFHPVTHTKFVTGCW